MIRGREDYAILAILLLLTALVYANSLNNPFVIDDQHIIVRNLLLRQWSLGDILKSHLFAPLGVESQYYRPLTLLTFAINYSVSGLNPLGYHIVNLALQLLVVSLSYLLLSRFVPSWIAGFSCALFAVHPANVQAVSYISSRSDPLYTVLTLSSLLCWLKGGETEVTHRLIFRGFSLFLFLLGLFAKETAIVIPALIVLTDLIWKADRGWRQKLAKNWAWYLSFGIVLAVYIGIRIGFAGYALNMEGSREVWKEGRELGAWPRILLALELLGSYLRLALFPLNLAFFRDVPMPKGFLDPGVLLGLVALAMMIVLALFSWSRRREVSYGISWFLISMMPVLNLTTLNAAMMEHWLYLPLVGLALATVSCVHTVMQKVGESRGAALGLVLALVLLSAKTVSRNAEWGDPIKLSQNDALLYPNEEKNWFLLGYAYFDRGMADQAIRAYQTGLAINPNHAYAWSGLGEALSMVGRDEEAEKSFLKAISIVPENPWLHYVLGIHRLKTGKVEAAIEALTRAVSLNPPIPMAYHVLGSAYLRLDKKDAAEKAFRKALSMLPREDDTHAAVHIELGRLYLDQGEKNKAKEEWQLALRFQPDSAEAKALLQKQANP